MKKDFLISKNRLVLNLKTLWRCPFLLPKVLRLFWRKFFLKQNVLRLVEIAVGYECNSDCEQCSCASSYNPKRRRLALQEFKMVIDEAIKLGAFQFNLTGGEPLLYEKDVLALITYIRKRGCYAHLCTNALLLDAKKIILLKKLGLNSLEFGLDSASEKVHDRNRRAGAYKRVMTATQVARNLGITVLWDTIITLEKIKNGDLLALIKLAKKQKALLQVTPPCVIGKWQGKKEILLDKKGQRFFKKILANSWVRTDTYSGLSKIGCSAAKEKLAINPYGDILPCSLIQIPYGNVLKDRLGDIQIKMLQNRFYLLDKGIFSCLPSFNLKFIKKYL